MSEEIWKTIEDFPEYEVSDKGHVRNAKTKHVRSCARCRGYSYVDLYPSGKTRTVHRLVAETFLGKHPGMQVNHIDGNKANNQLSNLEWCTCSENIIHAYNNNLRRPPKEKPVLVKETGEIFQSITQCAEAIDGNVQNVSACLHGKRDNCFGLHFEYAHEDIDKTPNILYDFQMEAVKNASIGSIFNGGTGTGKSRTGLYFYFKEQGGWYEGSNYTPMKNPKDLYILTTAAKRDKGEWSEEMALFRMSDDPRSNIYSNKIVIDSWNNIKKYVDVTDSFFIFDEAKACGSGAWAKTFVKIAKRNDWIMLSATAGDRWIDYWAVFVANGFYKNKSEFTREHVVYTNYGGYPRIDRYVNTQRLMRLRNRILIDMEVTRHTVPHHEDVYCNYNIPLYKDVIRNRWDPYKNEPLKQSSELCYLLRKIVNSDESRQVKLLELLEDHPRAIIFYSYDYERDILISLGYGDDVEVAEWTGHKHQPVPNSEKWVYLVNYASGAEGFNCISTNTIIFYSQTYSYKTLTQAAGRVDRLNTKYIDLYYYHLKSRSGIDLAISKALREKKKFNEQKWLDSWK